jgi:hypothetical protein
MRRWPLAAVVSLNTLAYDTGLPRSWLRAQALAGRIPCLRAGRKLLFSPEAVEKALAELAGQGRLASGGRESERAR